MNKLKNPYQGFAMIDDALAKLEDLAPQMQALNRKSAVRKRKLLASYSMQLPPKKRVIVHAVLYNIRQMHAEKLDSYRRSHVLSDHAFIRILERVHGLDIQELKDKAYRSLEGRPDLKPQWSEDKTNIMTVY